MHDGGGGNGGDDGNGGGGGGDGNGGGGDGNGGGGGDGVGGGGADNVGVPERNCHCDRLETCPVCIAKQPCPQHDDDWVQCNGPCERWFHIECTGWKLENGALVAPWNDELSIPLAAETQGDHPWYCVKCWEVAVKHPKKLGTAAQQEEGVPAQPPTDPDPKFNSDELKELAKLHLRAARLGLFVPEQTVHNMSYQEKQNLSNKIASYHDHLKEIVEDDALLTTILDSKPRPYPHVVPMTKQARSKMAIHGRRFELLMLSIRIIKCDCCGVVRPVQHDPWLDKKNSGFAHDPISGQKTGFARHQLVGSLHDAFRCTCNSSICQGDQFFAAKRPNLRRSDKSKWFKEEHNGIHPKHVASVTEVKLCDDCYHSNTKEQDFGLEAVLCKERIRS